MNLITGTLSEKLNSSVGLRNIAARLLWFGGVYRLSIRTNRTNGERHLRPEKKGSRFEKCISLVGLIAAHLLWLRSCLQVIDPYESYE